ncbi:hypothetical protein [Corynebacterium alimapuense]|uniref:Uncharacterized protein n=1 Tax=Corynebacterium alimapuense TaxID=1576874 RepID=A0A3M8K9I1_9CORY|nr:hypothetical protein [Corynebacterium alimapuense]RNE49871.1 hypothetical protein C5L39_00395 [Corynebacterium alimapuense]
MSNRSPRRLPKEIYVRRRIAALVAILVLVGLLSWGMVAFANRSGESTQDESNAASAIATSTTVTSSETSSASSSTSAPSSEETTESEEPATESSTLAAAEAVGCELSDLQIVATSDRSSYDADMQPTFYMTVTNSTSSDCVIDLDEDVLRFEVYHLSDNRRVWADTDCYASVLDGEETFEAEGERSFQAVWSRLGSEEGQCSDREPVEPGAYFVHAVIGDNPSDAHTFNLK